MNLLIPALALCVTGSGPGNTAFPLLKVGQGPRAAAMGESFTGLSDDASAIYWNPAGLGQLTGYQFSLSHHEWFADIKDEVAHIALPAGPGALGLGVVYSGEPGVLYWDPDLMQYESFRSWSATLSAGYGLGLSDKLGLGAAVTGLYQDLRLQQGYGCALDIGAVGSPLQNLGVGMAARHLGAMWFDGNAELLPMEAAAGVSYATGMFRVTMDAVLPVPFDRIPDFKTGVEFSPVRDLALRLGYRTGPIDLSSLGYLYGLSAGIGINVGSFGFDYAVVPYGDLGMTHRLGIRAALPPAAHSQSSVVTQARTDSHLNTNAASEPAQESGVEALSAGAGRHPAETSRLPELTCGLTGGIYAAGDSQPTGGIAVLRSPSYSQQTVAPDQGTFEISGVPAAAAVLAAHGPSEAYLPQTCTLQLRPGETVRHDFYLWKKGDPLGPDIVNFASNRSEIRDEDVPVLDRIGRILGHDRSIGKVELAGHTDSAEGDPQTKSELSLARAQAVQYYLVEKCGIAAERLVLKGYGDEEPLRSNSRPSGRAWNRRAEVRILE
ncbi:MAG: PorV/PorQ family protein [candidate division WOR-3 bacterium]|nr:MAG: PorV/PorQ family protein [candidate division WOR-3 bacterium]